MRFVADYFPLLLFFVAFKWQGIWVATAVAIAASVIQIAWFHWRGSVSAVHWASLAIIVIFGGATLLLHDETFIKWKPTVLYWLFGATIAGAQFAGRNLIRFMLKEQMALPEPAWARLAWSWVAFFALMGAVNLFVAYRFTTEQWVNFKLFGGIGLMLLFVLGQAAFLSRYAQEEKR